MQHSGSVMPVVEKESRDRIMTNRGDQGTRHVPPIDWLEASMWTLLITMSFALALVVIR
jgi:hypothetical protein